jgi:hypothetical protein
MLSTASLDAFNTPLMTQGRSITRQSTTSSHMTNTLLALHPELAGHVVIDTVGDGNCGPRAVGIGNELNPSAQVHHPRYRIMADIFMAKDPEVANVLDVNGTMLILLILIHYINCSMYYRWT